MKIFSAIKEMMFPDGIKCLACGREIYYNRNTVFCNECNPQPNTIFCMRCGRSTANLAQYCPVCSNTPYFFEYARAPYCYDDEAISVIVKKFKFKHQKYLGSFMVKKMLSMINPDELTLKAVTFAPMTPKKQKRRGFNQAKFLANKISKALKLPIKEYLVKETGIEIKSLAKADRITAVRSTIKINELETGDKNGIVLFVDDVFTTGATANECARLLKKKFAEKVVVLTFATSRVVPLII